MSATSWATCRSASSREMLGGHGEEVRDPPRSGRHCSGRASPIAKTGRSAVINIWVDPREYAPGTKEQTMYK